MSLAQELDELAGPFFTVPGELQDDDRLPVDVLAALGLDNPEVPE